MVDYARYEKLKTLRKWAGDKSEHPIRVRNAGYRELKRRGFKIETDDNQRDGASLTISW